MAKGTGVITKDILRVGDVCEIFGLSSRKVEAWIAEGINLGPIFNKIGQSWFTTREKLMSAIEDGVSATPAAPAKKEVN